MDDVMQQVPDDAPLMVAWRAYCDTEEYKYSHYWAQTAEHTDGALWAAFMEGFRAAQRIEAVANGTV